MDEITTTGQLREIWVSSMQSTDASCAYNESFTIQLRGTVDKKLLEQALLDVVIRHDALSATFSSDGTFMRKQITSHPTVRAHDLRSLDNEAGDRYVNNLLNQEITSPFDLEYGPLWRAHLIVKSDSHIILLFTVHHIVCDGWSLNLLARNVGKAYDMLQTGQSTSLEQSASFFDYVKDAVGSENDNQKNESNEFWKKRLSLPVPVLDLPTDYARPLQRTYKAQSKRSLIDPTITNQIKKTAADNGCNHFSYLLGAYIVLLNKLTSSDDIIIGIPVAGQSFYKSPNVVGHCVSMLPIRMSIHPDKPFDTFAASLQNELLDAYDHHALTFGDIVKELKLPRDSSRIPLVSTGFTYTKMPGHGEFGFNNLDAQCTVNSRAFEIFELYVTVIETKNGMELLWHFNSDLFSESTIERWIEEYQIVLKGIAENSQTTISALPILTFAERVALFETWNATDRQFNPDLTVVTMFEQQVALTPDAIALEFRGETLTYSQLNEKAEHLAAYLQTLGAGPDIPAAFCLQRSLDMVISLLAILKSGRAYIPVDPAFPDERIQFIIQDSGAGLLITTREISKRFPDLKIPLINPSMFPVTQAERIGQTLSGEQCAYIIYTSGSTGKPKGVEIRHFSLTNFLIAMRETPGMNANDSILAVTTVSFDIAGLELLCPLICGAKILLVEKELSADPARLIDCINQQKPSIMQATPATWTMLLDSGWNKAGWMKILCGGEAMTRTLANRLLSTGAEVWNMYGPTETTIWSSIFKVVAGDSSPPVGKPIANTQFYILDSHLSPVPTGACGDLYISGAGLARGYRNRSDLTKEKFISNPFSHHLYSELDNRMYKTGDIARWRNDGTVEVMGRSDFQVKIRGFRIELGEIENVALSHPQVRQCVAICKEYSTGDFRLLLYFSLQKQGALTSTEIRSHLQEQLPDYMVPKHFIELESLPLTASGKIDRKSLPSPFQNEKDNQKTEPSSPGELYLSSIWKQVLGISAICANDNFFDLGGHSLLSVKVVTQVKRDHGIDIDPKALILNTLEQIAANYNLNTALENTIAPESQKQKHSLFVNIRNILKKRK